MVRPGFGLIEVLVALTLLGIVMLGVAGSTLLAARLLGEAEATEQSALAALHVMDSLVQEASPANGERVAGRLAIRWQVQRDSTLQSIAVSVTFPNGSTMRTVHYRLVHAPVIR
jgi:prepilin-type N-terminal cleavage/methylation domain-containing protein